MESTASPDRSALDPFAEQVRGTVLRPGDGSYAEARRVYNDAVDREPFAIVRCAGTADVLAAVEFAREHDLSLSVKGGGHSIAGHAVCDGGLMVDLSPMDAVRVDPTTRTVGVHGGATWGDVNHEMRRFGLDIVGMPYEAVGVAGFTLGGGIGYLTPKHGLALDNLRAVDVVTADGELVHASEDEHPDLFWALRGGSGNFGIVTSLEFDCHEVTLEALSGQFLYPLDQLGEVLRFYRKLVADAPPELTGAAGAIRLPSQAAPSPELAGETLAFHGVTYMGDTAGGESVLQPAREFGDPIVHSVRSVPYSELGNEPLETGRRNHWESQFFGEISDEAIETFVERAVPLPTPLEVNFYPIGGAMNRVDPTATAFAHRDARHLFEVTLQWADRADDEEYVAWAESVHEAMKPHSTGGEYVNNQPDVGPHRAEAAYGQNRDRLSQLKTEWDPENLFSANQNISPTT